MHFKILVVEDEPLYAGHLEMLIDQLGHECIGTIDNGKEVLAFMSDHSPDLILMDINISGEMDGIELGKVINQKEITPIIFITSLRDDETFERSKSAKAYGFILKPFDSVQLQRTIELVLFGLDKGHSKDAGDDNDPDLTAVWKNNFFVKKGSMLVKVEIDQILYIEVEERYCSIFTSDQNRHLMRISLSELLKKLPHYFVQSHRKFAFNLNRLRSIDVAENLIMLDEDEIPLGKNYKEDVLKVINDLE